MRYNRKTALVFAFVSAALAPVVCAADVVQDSGVSGGLLVQLNCGTGRETAALASGGRFLVHGLDANAANVAAAREYLRAQGLYGRVSVARYDGRTLPYADNTINLLVADSLGKVPEVEALRVLVPGGVLLVNGKRTVKPWPQGLDDWPQYLNKADNNAVARDSVIGPPRRIQWMDYPLWSRSHMAISTVVSVVTGNGRLFSIEDAAPTDNPFLPAAFRLVARDAFNGSTLWTHNITRWESITMYIKCLPVQQQRRMAVVGDTLYCTFELEGPVSAVEAATGKVLKVYENTSPAQEVAYDQGLLFVNVGDRFPSAAYNIVKLKGKPFEEGVDPSQPFYGCGFKEGYAPEIKDKEHPTSVILALDPKTGNVLWKTQPLNTYTAASLTIKGQYAVYQTADGLFCVDARTGKPRWAQKKPIHNAVGHDSHTPGTSPNTVVIGDDKVFAVEAQPLGSKAASNAKSTLHAYSLVDGRPLWQAPVLGNYESSADVFYVEGNVWVGGGGVPTAYDAKTGKVVKTLKQRMNGPMSHDRCYRNMITEKYYINSKTGGADFLDLKTGTEIPNHWTRGTCGLGVLPANGLLYSTPYSCSCSAGSMFQGFNAYTSVPGLTKSNDPIPVERVVHLERGPAYGQPLSGPAAADDDWPMYRHDGARTGVTAARIAPRLTERWKAKLPTRPTAPVLAAGKVFVAAADSHTLYALDANNGSALWTFTADGRIDSPPVYYQGLVLFGSRDGWLYCVRADNGQLVYRFKDLPDRLVYAYGQLESAWPVSGSVLLLDDKVYFTAGRSSFLDGGIFLYCLEPGTGKLLNSRGVYGPFDSETGFPIAAKGSVNAAGFKNDLLVTDGTNLYLRHKAFTLELADAETPQPHLMPIAGFLDSRTQHRTGSILSTSFGWWQSARDLMIVRDKSIFEVEGFPIYHNHSYFDPRRNGYKLIASDLGPAPGRKGKGSGKAAVRRTEKWRTNMPLSGRALALAGEVLFVAGEPMTFDEPSYQNYVAAYNGKLGGRLLAASAVDGKHLAEYKLDADPVWDSLALANGRLLLCLQDGTVRCYGE